jgi:hypothetical protein
VNDNHIRGLRTFKEKSFYRKDARAQWIFETVPFHFLLLTLYTSINTSPLCGFKASLTGIICSSSTTMKAMANISPCISKPVLVSGNFSIAM